MFRKSSSHSQGNLFSSISSILEGKSLNQYNDTSGWHNQFSKQIILRIPCSLSNSGLTCW